jgi:hypothetical protein
MTVILSASVWNSEYPGASAGVDSFVVGMLRQGHYWTLASGKIVIMLNAFHGLKF